MPGSGSLLQPPGTCDVDRYGHCLHQLSPHLLGECQPGAACLVSLWACWLREPAITLKATQVCQGWSFSLQVPHYIEWDTSPLRFGIFLSDKSLNLLEDAPNRNSCHQDIYPSLPTPPNTTPDLLYFPQVLSYSVQLTHLLLGAAGSVSSLRPPGPQRYWNPPSGEIPAGDPCPCCLSALFWSWSLPSG